MMRPLVCAACFALLAGPLLGQTATPPSTTPAPTFQVADIHSSPHTIFSFMPPPHLGGDRYSLHQATMTQLIATAYGVKADNVQGGPSWLDYDHFDIIAKVPPATPPDTLKLMLQALLKDRFNLVVHNGTGPVSGTLLTLEKAKPSLKQSTGAEDSDCPSDPPATEPPPAGVIPQAVIHCHNVTMEKFAQILRMKAGGYLFNKPPIVENTGLKGAYDFDLHWTSQGDLARAGADGISIYDALEQQLGLKLAPGVVQQPVLLVDKVNETPTPNPPDIAKLLPPLPPAQFEVAVIKPSKPDQRGMAGITADRVDVRGLTLKELISFVWQINPLDNDSLVGAPPWLDKDKFDFLAKMATDDSATVAPKGPPVDFDQLWQLLQALIVDRFQMKYHMEERPVTAYNLVAVNPRLQKADPTARTKCTEGPGPDGKDPRTANPVLNRLLYCQNMSMAQLADQLQHFANGFIYGPVKDETGIPGGWNFTLNFSSIGYVKPGIGGLPPPPLPPGTPGAPSDPSGALSLFDAVRQQLGLKLEKGKRTAPVLVIDHINETPTEN